MTTHNGARHLVEQLDSIAAQHYQPIEVVIGDDASTDASLELLSSFSAQAGFPVRIQRHEQQLGLRRNLESVLRSCHGSVIVLADQDDVWAASRLDTIVSAFTSDPATTLWFSQAGLIDGSGRPLGRTTWDAVHLTPEVANELSRGAQLRRLLFGMTITGATMAFRASVLTTALPLPEELDGPDHLFLHDGWIAVLSAALGRTIAEPRLLSSYRQHAGQVTGMSMTAPAHDGDDPTPSRELRQESARLGLVLGRLRERGVLERCRPDARDALLDLEQFFSSRLAPVSDWGRLPGIAARVWDGSYRRHARGLRTAIGDLIRPL